MRRTSGRNLRIAILSIIAIALSLLSSAVVAQPARAGVVLVTASDETDKPVAGVLVEVKLKGSVAASAVTNDKGEADFPNLLPGSYDVVVSKESFEPLTQSDVALTAGA